MVIWTVEEEGLIGCYWKEGCSSIELRFKIINAVPFMEPEIFEIARSAIKKLEQLPESEYRKMSFQAG